MHTIKAIIRQTVIAEGGDIPIHPKPRIKKTSAAQAPILIRNWSWQQRSCRWVMPGLVCRRPDYIYLLMLCVVRVAGSNI